MAMTPASEGAVSLAKEAYREMLEGAPVPEVVLVTVDLLVAQRNHLLDMVAILEDQIEQCGLLYNRSRPGVLHPRLRKP